MPLSINARAVHQTANSSLKNSYSRRRYISSSLFFLLPYKKIHGLLIILLILINTPQVPAPVPRCSPFIFINKLSEWSNLKSDANPYFPVPPCEYGNPINALKAKDYESVFVLAHPERVPLHNLYEALWFFKTGFPRFLRFITGKQKFVYDKNILFEGYQHYTKYPRTKKVGFKTHRDTSFIDDKNKWKRHMLHKLAVLKTQGPDKFDPHEDHRDGSFYKRPSYHHGHYTLHNSQKSGQAHPTNSFDQSPIDSQVTLPFTQPQKLSQSSSQSLQHPNHNYDDAFQTPFISSEQYSQNRISSYDSFRPINSLNEVSKSPIKRQSGSFRFPQDSQSRSSEFPAPSPFNYADRISNRRKGLFPSDENEETSRQFRKDSTVLQQIAQRPRRPTAGGNLKFGYNNPNFEGKFDIFHGHTHPSFQQIAGGKLPSVEEIKKVTQPNKLLTSDLGQNPQNYNPGGHVIDGSSKRNFRSSSQGNKSEKTIFQYLLSKIG